MYNIKHYNNSYCDIWFFFLTRTFVVLQILLAPTNVSDLQKSFILNLNKEKIHNIDTVVNFA